MEGTLLFLPAAIATVRLTFLPGRYATGTWQPGRCASVAPPAQTRAFGAAEAARPNASVHPKARPSRTCASAGRRPEAGSHAHRAADPPARLRTGAAGD